MNELIQKANNGYDLILLSEELRRDRIVSILSELQTSLSRNPALSKQVQILQRQLDALKAPAILKNQS